MSNADVQVLIKKYERIWKELGLIKSNIKIINESVAEIKQDNRRVGMKQAQDDRVFVDLVLEIKDTIKSLDKNTTELIARVDKLEEKLNAAKK